MEIPTEDNLDPWVTPDEDPYWTDADRLGAILGVAAMICIILLITGLVMAPIGGGR